MAKWYNSQTEYIQYGKNILNSAYKDNWFLVFPTTLFHCVRIMPSRISNHMITACNNLNKLWVGWKNETSYKSMCRYLFLLCIEKKMKWKLGQRVSSIKMKNMTGKMKKENSFLFSLLMFYFTSSNYPETPYCMKMPLVNKPILYLFSAPGSSISFLILRDTYKNKAFLWNDDKKLASAMTASSSLTREEITG